MIAGTDRYPTRDHVHPKSYGGKKGSNILIVCNPCNNEKADMTLERFAQKLTMCGDDRANLVWDLVEKFRSATHTEGERAP